MSSQRRPPSARRRDGSAGRADPRHPARALCCGRSARSRRRGARPGGRADGSLRRSRGGCGAPRSRRGLGGGRHPRPRCRSRASGGRRGVGEMVWRTRPAAPGFKLAAEGCSVRASIRSDVRPPSRLRSRLAGFLPGVEPAVRVAERPDLREAVAEGQRRVGPADHPGEVRVTGRPVVHRALGQPGNLPALAAILRAPDARAVPVAARPIVPVAPSPTRWLIGQPSQCGPVTFQPLRSRPPEIRNAPLVVPTRIVMSFEATMCALQSAEGRYHPHLARLGADLVASEKRFAERVRARAARRRRRRMGHVVPFLLTRARTRVRRNGNVCLMRLIASR